jgi:methylaspartate mutase sigma subunit
VVAKARRKLGENPWIDSPPDRVCGSGPAPVDRRCVILAVAASDAHVVANVLIAAELRRHGFYVVNLGPCTPISTICDAAERHPQAEAVLIGSLNGHAHEDLRELPRARREREFDLPVILGGNLSVGAEKGESDLSRLYELGVTRILTDFSPLFGVLDELAAPRAVAA